MIKEPNIYYIFNQFQNQHIKDDYMTQYLSNQTTKLKEK